jgi:hypothetical protein
MTTEENDELNSGTTPLLPASGYRHTACGSDRAELFNAPNFGAYCWACGKTVPVEEVVKP